MAYFHAVTSGRRRRNRIESLVDKGVAVLGKDEISKFVLQFYNSLYTLDGGPRPTLKHLDFSSLDLSLCAELEKPFEEEEIERGDILDFFMEFLNGMELDKGTGATFITLIPEVAGATKIVDFCPISLVGTLYKILAKVLAERLKKVLPVVISDYQSAIVAKRQILDCSLIANEAIDYYRRLK
ncbi:uncharacterized protein LOC143885987 [Tasmannia lanceolata]|uniref:uncharacterized protein LOC143885987 n=1 Tax=Tasmannia lanceolata TaxID=3420 RepID=UPI004063BD3C